MSACVVWIGAVATGWDTVPAALLACCSLTVSSMLNSGCSVGALGRRIPVSTSISSRTPVRVRLVSASMGFSACTVGADRSGDMLGAIVTGSCATGSSAALWYGGPSFSRSATFAANLILNAASCSDFCRSIL